MLQNQELRGGVFTATKLFACRCHLSLTDSTTVEDLACVRVELRGAGLAWRAQGVPRSCVSCSLAWALPASCPTAILPAGPGDT